MGSFTVLCTPGWFFAAELFNHLRYCLFIFTDQKEYNLDPMSTSALQDEGKQELVGERVRMAAWFDSSARALRWPKWIKN